jgi:colanic acid/amylovoran biosynthesis glycosyltransferase
MPSKRIAMVVSTFPKTSETFIVNKALGLFGRGWDVQIVCTRSAPDEWKVFTGLAGMDDLRQRVHLQPSTRPRWLAAAKAPGLVAKSVAFNPGAAWRTVRSAEARGVAGLYVDSALLALKPDIVHFEFGGLAVGRTHLGASLGAKIVVSFRGADLNFSGIETPDYYTEVWKRVDALHLLGTDLWTRAQRRGCPTEKLHALIPPAIDTEFFDGGERKHTNVAGRPELPLRLLAVGRLEWKKGYEHLLRVARQLVDRQVNFKLNIIGAGATHDPLAFLIHELGLTDRVSLLGPKSRSDIRAELSSADVFVHAAVSEGFCNAVVEAQAMGVPVVCSDADGLGENIEHGVTGFLCPRRDTLAMADSIVRLAANPELRTQMGCAGRARVVDRFQLNRQIEAFDQFYRRVLDDGSSPHSQQRNELGR